MKPIQPANSNHHRLLKPLSEQNLKNIYDDKSDLFQHLSMHYRKDDYIESSGKFRSNVV